MHCSNALLGLLAISAATVNAQTGQTIQVTVGTADGKLVYSPNNIVAPVGTQIEFSFFPKACNSTND
jgi:plastocyanin